MNWSDKSSEIANSIIKELKISLDATDMPTIRKALEKAAIMGMEYECENFILQRK
jgi:hypothetical protein